MKKSFTKAMPLLLAALTALTGCGQTKYSGDNAEPPVSSPESVFKQQGAVSEEYETAMYANDAGSLSMARKSPNFITTPEQIPDFNTEEYSAITENSFKSTVTDPLSTFSADVDTACYSNLRRMIREGSEIPQDSVRIEEMINYFHYNYPEPNGNEPFSVTTELADCPLNSDTKLMMIGMKAKDIDMSERKPMNLVFLIDVSGSMYSYDKLPLVQKSFSMLTEELNANDRISIVTYAGEDSVVLEGASGSEGLRIREAIDSLEAGGATAGAAGINTAYDIAAKYFINGGNNRIILATDGDLNVGISSEAELKRLVESKRDKGIFLSVLGFGTGNIKDNKMETLADNGNGNYSYIDSEIEAKRVLVEEMGGTLVTVAKDVKFQVEFNPAYIKGYRLIGYENRQLAAEDFNDDTKDAGEIGAGHTVTVLYEIADINSKMDFSSSDLKYGDSSAKGTENGEFCTVSVRYKEPDGDTSKLLAYPVTESSRKAEMSDDLRFASSVAAFGLILRNSSNKGTANKNLVLSLIPESTRNDAYKQEFAELVNAYKVAS